MGNDSCHCIAILIEFNLRKLSVDFVKITWHGINLGYIFRNHKRQLIVRTKVKVNNKSKLHEKLNKFEIN